MSFFALLILSISLCNAVPIEVNEHTPCPSLPDIAHGRKVFVKDSSWEEENICRVHFVCDNGYHMEGSPNMYCFYGEWTGTVPECTSNPCEALLAPDNGQITFVGPIQPYLTHSIAEVTCNNGFLIEENKDNVIICKESGIWSDEIPQCIEHSICNSTGEEVVVIPGDNSTNQAGSYCNSNPCLNGGTCTDYITYYMCTCPEHYNGHDCEHKTENTCEASDRYVHCGLGMTDGRIKDDQITAFGTYSNQHPHYARLNETEISWMASLGSDSWIQVNFSSPVDVSGVLTRGDDRSAYWVATFSVQYLDADGELKYIMDSNPSNGVKIFPGNTDHNSVRANYFDAVVTTTIIRINPISSNADYFALRFELLTPTDLNSEEGKNIPSGAVCRFKKSDVAVDDSKQCSEYNGDCGIGMADGRIADSQITAINYYSTNYYPYYGRLTREYYGWEPRQATLEAWIQIEMANATEISGVMTRGGGHHNSWVTAFKIQYGNSTDALSTVQDEYADRVFPGNWDTTSIRTSYFDTVTAKYLRLVVIYGSSNVEDYANELRMEILTPTNLMSAEARSLPEGTICQYESHRFIATPNDHVLMLV